MSEPLHTERFSDEALITILTQAAGNLAEGKDGITAALLLELVARYEQAREKLQRARGAADRTPHR